MPLRLIEIVVPKNLADGIERLSCLDDVLGRWENAIDKSRVLVRMLVDAQQTEGVIDELEQHFSKSEEFRVLLLPVEATLPRPPEPESDDFPVESKLPERISREELYNDITTGSRLSRVFVAQVVLATLVAAVGLMRNDMAVIIGAMVIAPLLGPNVSLCLATTLGDTKLALRSLKTNLVGIILAIAISMLIGVLFEIHPNIPSIQSRSNVTGGDIILALAAGCAGVLAFTTGAPATLIGVMVAVALLPPTVVFGLLLSAGQWQAATGTWLLVTTNVICVNLAGVLTFVAQGVRPQSWWEAKRAKRATRISIATWLVLLAILGLLIFFELGPSV